MKTHSGEKSKECNQCNFASSSAGSLGAYLKIHSGEKANKCNQCDFASSQAGILRAHLMIHSGEKSNKCNQCDYASQYLRDTRVSVHCSVSQQNQESYNQDRADEEYKKKEVMKSRRDFCTYIFQTESVVHSNVF